MKRKVIKVSNESLLSTRNESSKLDGVSIKSVGRASEHTRSLDGTWYSYVRIELSNGSEVYMPLNVDTNKVAPHEDIWHFITAYHLNTPAYKYIAGSPKLLREVNKSLKSTALESVSKVSKIRRRRRASESLSVASPESTHLDLVVANNRLIKVMNELNTKYRLGASYIDKVGSESLLEAILKGDTTPSTSEDFIRALRDFRSYIADMKYLITQKLPEYPGLDYLSELSELDSIYQSLVDLVNTGHYSRVASESSLAPSTTSSIDPTLLKDLKSVRPRVTQVVAELKEVMGDYGVYLLGTTGVDTLLESAVTAESILRTSLTHRGIDHLRTTSQNVVSNLLNIKEITESPTYRRRFHIVNIVVDSALPVFENLLRILE